MSCTVTGLTNGDTYSFTTTASNGVAATAASVSRSEASASRAAWAGSHGGISRVFERPG